MLHFISTDLQLYKIFKITRVSFFWHTVYICALLPICNLAAIM